MAMTRSPAARPSVLRLLSDALLLGLLLWAPAGWFCTAFALPVDPWLLYGGLTLLTLLSLSMFSLPLRFGMPLLFLSSLLWGQLVWRTWEDLFAGQAAIQCAVVNAYSERFPGLSRLVPVMERTPAQWSWAVTLTVLAAAAVYSVLLGLLVVRLRACWAGGLAVLVPVIPTLPLGAPPVLWLVLLLTGWGGLLLTARSAREDPRGAARLTLAALPLVGITMGLLTLAVPAAGYRPPAWVTHSRDTLFQTLGDLSLSLNWSGPFGGSLFSSAGSTPTVDLSAAGTQRYDGHTVLRIRTDYTGKLYLRGYSAALYQDNRWTPLEEDAYDALLADGCVVDSTGTSSGLNPLNFPARTDPTLPYYAFEVEQVSAPGGCVYFPYQVLSRPEELRGASFQDDSGMVRDRFVGTHTVYFRPGLLEPDAAPPLEWQDALVEQEYQKFVQQHYLQVPDDLLSDLLPHIYTLSDRLFQAQTSSSRYGSYSAYDPARSPQVAAELVVEYLDELAEYDLSTPPVPDREDFTLYFLNESHRGYCMHFASAGTLLLRSLGVPARYVSGYVTYAQTPGSHTVPDRAAHAWVEVYLSGYGWYPVEMTPGYQGDALPWSPGENGEPAATPSAAPEPTPTPKPSAAPVQTPQPTFSAPPAQTHSDGGAQPLPGWLLPVGILLAACFLPILIRYVTGTLRRRRLRQEDPHRAMVSIYRYARRLSRHGGTPPPLVEELAQKAAFSREGVTSEECRQARKAACAEAERLYRSLPWWRRLLLRWFWFLW